MYKYFIIIFVFLMPFSLLAQDELDLSASDPNELPTTWVGAWEINCRIDKFPTVMSANRYGNGHRIPVHICTAEQSIGLQDYDKNITLTAKLTPFYLMFKLHHMAVDTRYTKLFVGAHAPWHLYANCHDVHGDQSCVFWLGDAHDLVAVKKAMYHEHDFMVQMTDKHSGEPLHFVFPLNGYRDIIHSMDEAARAVEYAYQDLQGSDEV